jgi:agmatinase
MPDAEALRQRRPDVAILGVPFDDRVSNRPGARFGPRAIREANPTTGAHSIALDVEPFTVLDVVDAGDVPIVPSLPERGHALTYQRVHEVLSSGALPVILGGDHSLTWPVVSAVAEALAPARVGMIHFDAHADTADDENGVHAGHGTPMRRLVDSGVVEGRSLVQVGLRGYWPPPDVFAWMRDQGFRWHTMTEIEDRGIDAVVDDAIAEVTEHADAIYLSIDIDVVDPGMAPGTGTPEPGGLLARELLRSVRRIARSVPLAGMDVMEVAPPYDHAELTAMVAHRCVFEAVSGIAARRLAEVSRSGHAVARA